MARKSHLQNERQKVANPHLGGSHIIILATVWVVVFADIVMRMMLLLSLKLHKRLISRSRRLQTFYAPVHLPAICSVALRLELAHELIYLQASSNILSYILAPSFVALQWLVIFSGLLIQ